MTPEVTFSNSVSSGYLVPQGQESVASVGRVSASQGSAARRLKAFLETLWSQYADNQQHVGELAEILNEIEELRLSQETEDEDGFVFRIEPRASGHAKTYILKAYRVITGTFPRPKIEPDGEGGIVLDWRRNEKIIRLAFRAKQNQRDYIYHQFGDEHDAKPFSFPFLLNRLRWLAKDE